MPQKWAHRRPSTSCQDFLECDYIEAIYSELTTSVGGTTYMGQSERLSPRPDQQGGSSGRAGSIVSLNAGSAIDGSTWAVDDIMMYEAGPGSISSASPRLLPLSFLPTRRYLLRQPCAPTRAASGVWESPCLVPATLSHGVLDTESCVHSESTTCDLPTRADGTNSNLVLHDSQPTPIRPASISWRKLRG